MKRKMINESRFMREFLLRVSFDKIFFYYKEEKNKRGKNLQEITQEKAKKFEQKPF